MKVYVKPEVRIEKFNLSKHIAACAFDMSNSKNKDECVAVGDAVGEKFGVPNIVLFSDNNTSCIEKDSVWNMYCYTNGTSGNNTFNS